MTLQSSNYTAFYVAEPFNSSALGAHATKDFCYYNLLRSWKGQDSSFPFNDAHSMTYSVRDGSDWENTLKPRLRARIRHSKNIVLFMSSSTISSRAIREEIDYGINDQQLPVIVIYPEYTTKASLLEGGELSNKIRGLWNKLPIFRDSMARVPSIHLPMDKGLIKMALESRNYVRGTTTAPDIYRYSA